jgi:hypothetical protein
MMTRFAVGMLTPAIRVTPVLHVQAQCADCVYPRPVEPGPCECLQTKARRGLGGLPVNRCRKMAGR